MSQIQYSVNLSGDDIPLLSALKSSTVIVGKIDQDFELEINSNNRLQKEKRIPQAYYAHNVMPTGQGYQSVGYIEKIAAHPTATDFNGAFTLRDIDENKSFFSPSGGKNYIWDRNIAQWRSVNPIIGNETALVTVAFLAGETYIYYEKIGCFKYNRVTQLLEAVVLIGLVTNQINGICAAQGFMLAWDDSNNVYRSQSTSPLDFTPDSALGSGAGVPEDIKGKIVVILPISNGYIVYTTDNAVGASFQQNIRYPFSYKEVTGSAGIASANHVSWLDNIGEHYAWTKAGLQKINKSVATPIFPELTDFLVAKIFEDYDTTIDDFIVTKLTSQVDVAVTVVGERFVVVSYGITPPVFTHAIVYDLAYKRFGKLKISHVNCFKFNIPNLSGDITWDMLGDLTWDDLGDTTWDDLGIQILTAETPKEIIAFLGMDGQIKIVNFDLVHTNDLGVLILGKYSYVRERLITIDSIEIDNFEENYNFTLVHFNSVNGKITKYKTNPFLELVDGLLKKYLCKRPFNTGKNHSFVFKGTFHLISVILTFHQDGRR